MTVYSSGARAVGVTVQVLKADQAAASSLDPMAERRQPLRTLDRATSSAAVIGKKKEERQFRSSFYFRYTR